VSVQVERKLAAIFAADIAGYNRLMGRDEAGTLARLKACRAVMDGLIAAHRGRIFNTAGDSVVADFASAVDAVQCAVAVQEAIGKEIATQLGGEAMRYRIGIHVGDVIVEGTNLFGDGVNIAARLEAVADPGGICVSGTVRDQIGTKLPVGFIDLGEQQVKNIAQPIRAYKIRDAANSAAAGSSLPLPDKPSIAVLPFANMSGDPEQEYFAEGMVEEIITALSRIRWLFVIARNSSFTYKGQAVDVKQVGRELGVRYVLEGSVRKAGQRVRINAQLIDALNGSHLWADRFDGSLEDVFDLQDKVAVSVAGVIEPTLQTAEIRRSSEQPTSDFTAYDLYLRAMPHFHANDKDRTSQALDLLAQAIERDRQFGPALALSAMCWVSFDTYGWADDLVANRRKGVDFARRALQMAEDDPVVLANAGYVLGRLGEDIDAAIALVNRSLELNPSFARGWHWAGWLSIQAGHPSLAMKQFETCSRLSPRDQTGMNLTGMGAAHFFDRRYEDAAAKLLVSIQHMPNWAVTYRFLASCYAHMGRLDEAREIVGRLRTLTPVVVPRVPPYRNAELRELFLSGLRLAAGETDKT
jgi:TolB-like protein/Tfp pilus assembly protein PilF